MWWQHVYAHLFFIQAEFVENHNTAEWTVERGWKINERGGREHCVGYKHVLHLRDCSILNFSVPVFPRGLGPVRHSPNFGSKNTDPVMVNSSSQPSDWTGLTCSCANESGSLPLLKHQACRLGYQCWKSPSPTHGRLPLRFTSKLNPTENIESCLSSFMSLTIICILVISNYVLTSFNRMKDHMEPLISSI